MIAVWTGVLLALVLLAYAAMWRGWRRRVRENTALLPELPAVPTEDARGDLVMTADGVLVSTTGQGGWLDRVAVHGLGTRANGSVSVYAAGVLFERGERLPLWVSRAALVAVRDERAQAGKVLPGGGIVLLTWQHDGSRFDTGFAPRHRAEHTRVLAAVGAMVKETSS